jgi:hypothetical protein
MSPEYRVEIVGCQFIVVDPSNEIVGRYTSQEEAQQTIEECRKEDQGWEAARLLVRNAITVRHTCKCTALTTILHGMRFGPQQRLRIELSNTRAGSNPLEQRRTSDWREGITEGIDAATRTHPSFE